MRKNILATVGLLALAVGAFAQSYTYPGAAQPWYYNQKEPGELVIASPQQQDNYMSNNMISFMLGASFPQEDSGIEVGESNKPKWGDTGVQYGVSYMRFLNEYFGLGVEISGMETADATEHYMYYDMLSSESSNFKANMSLFNVMLTGRLTVNPQQKVQVYFPFGLGFTSAKGTIKSTGIYRSPGYSEYWDEKYTAKTTSLGYFIGVGAEMNISGNGRWILGAELRYQGFTLDTDKYIPGEPINGKQHYKYFALLAKLGYRF